MKYFESVWRDGIQNLGSGCQMRNLDPTLPCRVLIHTINSQLAKANSLHQCATT